MDPCAVAVTKTTQRSQRCSGCSNSTQPKKCSRKTCVTCERFKFLKPCKKLFSPAIPARMAGENARPSKKNWPRKKRMASWARQRQQITEAADGGARARTGADGAVLNLRRGPGLRAALARGRAADRAGQHYYSHLACGLPAGTLTTRGWAQRLHPAAQRAEEARALLQGGAHTFQNPRGAAR